MLNKFTARIAKLKEENKNLKKEIKSLKAEIKANSKAIQMMYKDPLPYR